MLSNKASTLEFERIYCLSDEEAYAAFVALRFAENNGAPFCPKCGGTHLYLISTRRRWRCAVKECGATFSATSGTIFQDCKLSYKKLLLCAAYFVTTAKGMSAIDLKSLLSISYKSAFVLQHKLREVLDKHQSSLKLDGEVEIDALWCGGYVKPGKDNPSRRNRRRLNRNKEKQRVVMVARERHGRSRAFIVPKESAMPDLLPDVLEEDTIVFSDGFHGSAKISAKFQSFRVIHSKQYADGWISTNWAESFFSRLRRKELGTHHKIAGPYTRQYANEACWREDNRRISNGDKYNQLLRLAGQHPVSRDWKGYWQRRKEAA